MSTRRKTESFPGRTLVALLRGRIQQEPSKKVYTWLADGDRESAYLTYSDLDRRARAISSQLQSLKLRKKTALLLYGPGLEFIEALFGCLYAGIIAVPAYVPGSARENPRIDGMLDDAGCGVALTTADSLEAVSQLVARTGTAPKTVCLATDLIGDEGIGDWAEGNSHADGVAYLQYTSGSTSMPKGVMVTHANVLANLKSIAEQGGFSASSVSVNWLPHFHDMGLIYGMLQPLFSGFPTILLSPAAFIHRPLRWLRAISQYRGTHCGGPNFAYDLCVERVGEEEKSSLDLSSWQVAYNGAEPVRPETLERFAAHFEPCGFQRDAFYPVYGLAEASLKVTSGVPGSGMRLRTVDAAAMRRNKVVLIEADAASAQRIVSCGRTSAGHEVAIVEPGSMTPCAEDHVGEIWVAGPSVAAGYWKNAAATRKTFKAFLKSGKGPYLRTGDLGFLHHGELFITGRLKDCIIIRGRNHYPQDLERTTESAHPALRRNGSAAFSVEEGGEERLVIVSELNRRYRGDPEECVAAVRAAVAEAHDIQVYVVVLIKSGALPRTSSGKVQRHACRKRWQENDLPIVIQSVLQSAEMEGQALTRQSVLEHSAGERKALVENYVRGQVARALHCSIDEINSDHSLISLGVDSLAGFDLMHRLEKDLGVVMPAAGLLEQSISGIALRILESLESGARREEGALALQRGVRPGLIPLSASQEQVWFLQQLFPGSCAYNEHLVIHLRGPLDRAALGQAVTGMVERHEILRTAFPMADGHPHQSIQPPQPVELPVMEIDGGEDGLQEERLRSIVAAETQRPFRLEQEPPVRFRLLRAADEEHWLLLVAHHIVCDGASLRVVVHELATMYEAFAHGRPSPLPPLEIQYADYAVWQRAWLQGEALEQQLGYWRGQLAGLEPLDLPTDRLRPAVMSHQGAVVPFHLPAATVEGLRELGRRSDATLFMCVLAGLQVMLGRYAGQQDVAVGTPVANRSQGLDRLIGFFVNTLVLRTELGGNPSFAELLARVRRMALGAYQHQDVPFEKLVDELHLERDLSRSPLVQVMLAFQPLPGRAMAFGNITFDFPIVDAGIAKFDLMLRVVNSNGDTSRDLEGFIEYSQSLFEPSTAEGMAQHLRMVLEQMVAMPEQKVDELSLLTEAEREQVLVEWNRTEADYPQHCVHELFEQQAARTPNAPAVEHDGEQISYAALDRRANQLAHFLRKRGVGPEVTVGVCLHRGVELVVALMGVLKAGGAYVPLDPDYPRERLQFMTADAQAAVLLTESGLRGLLGENHAQVICVDEQQKEIAAESVKAVHSGVVPQNLAYLIYTSGSTGKPKGIAIAHQSTNVLLHWVREMFLLEELEGVLASTSVCFDVSIFELFAPLSWGGKLIIIANALALPQLAEPEKIKIISTVPSAMAELVRMRVVPSSVRVVNLGGEAVPRSLVQQIYEHTKVERVLNMYGPSEDTTYSTCAFLTKEDAGRTMSIGRQVSNTQAYVLDENFQPLPARVPGELYLGGAGLARGYLNRPDMTAEKFLPNPFGATGGERLYRTGDRARWRSDGELEYLGRFDHQIKVRGYRVELGEIESALREQPGVAQAVVMVRGQGSAQRLVAYVVADGQQAASGSAALRAHLRGRLPEYMVP
ncbi:MAG: amino acid adenylation domain-containing protein, partial [Acidobacteriia bacterium]|nr:amino acid adenylation domain-containing protein [Terriglobia bacterium]